MPKHSSRVRFGFTALAGSLLALLLLSGCAVHHHDGHHARGVRAPRSAVHGHEYRHLGVVLVFEDSWNGYRVRSRPHHYFYRNAFYRWRGGHWHRASRPDGPWSSLSARALPASLARHHEHTAYRSARAERREERREDRYDRRHERRDDRYDRREDRREERFDRQEDRRAKKRSGRSKQPRERDADRRGIAANRGDD